MSETGMQSCYVDYTTRSIADLVDYYGLGMLITRINVPVKERGKGAGTKLLKAILADADRTHTTLFLEVVPTGGMTEEQLTAWYGRYGFKYWKGAMRRRPRWRSIQENPVYPKQRFGHTDFPGEGEEIIESPSTTPPWTAHKRRYTYSGNIYLSVCAGQGYYSTPKENIQEFGSYSEYEVALLKDDNFTLPSEVGVSGFDTAFSSDRVAAYMPANEVIRLRKALSEKFRSHNDNPVYPKTRPLLKIGDVVKVIREGDFYESAVGRVERIQADLYHVRFIGSVRLYRYHDLLKAPPGGFRDFHNNPVFGKKRHKYPVGSEVVVGEGGEGVIGDVRSIHETKDGYVYSLAFSRPTGVFFSKHWEDELDRVWHRPRFHEGQEITAYVGGPYKGVIKSVWWDKSQKWWTYNVLVELPLLPGLKERSVLISEHEHILIGWDERTKRGHTENPVFPKKRPFLGGGAPKFKNGDFVKINESADQHYGWVGLIIRAETTICENYAYHSYTVDFGPRALGRFRFFFPQAALERSASADIGPPPDWESLPRYNANPIYRKKRLERWPIFKVGDRVKIVKDTADWPGDLASPYIGSVGVVTEVHDAALRLFPMVGYEPNYEVQIHTASGALDNVWINQGKLQRVI